MLHVFIDTTVTYCDPFFKSNYGRFLLCMVRKLGGKLYISEVVLAETKRHLVSRANETLKKIKAECANVNRFVKDTVTLRLDGYVPQDGHELERFYKSLEAEGIFEIVEYANDLLPELVRRSVERVRPFSEKKQEFRDCIIWLSYAGLAEARRLCNCFLLTNNTSDYCTDRLSGLHPDLQKDSRKFTLCFSPEDFIKKHAKNLLRQTAPRRRLLRWVKSQNIDAEYVKAALIKYFYDQLYDGVSSHVAELGEPWKHSEDWVDYAEVSGIDVDCVTEFDYEVGDTDILYWGIAKVETCVDLYCHTPDWEPGEPDAYCVGDDTLTLEVEFSFTYSEDGGIDSFEVDRIVTSGERNEEGEAR